MWEEKENTKKNMSCCLLVGGGIFGVIGAIVLIVYSVFYAFFSGLAALGGQNGYTGDGTYMFPLEGAIYVNSHYDSVGRIIPEVYGDYEPHPHYGTDFHATYGTRVIASRAGTVSATYITYTGGYTATIDHGGGEETRYLHLLEFACNPGDTVEAGDLIAYSGNSGAYSTGAHLHFELRVNGVAVDPMSVLTSW